MILATLADLREIKMPLVGIVTLSFVPVLAALIVLGLWPALVVAVVSGLTSAWFMRDPVKIVFNVANYVVSTFVAGLVYLALAPTGGSFMSKVLPTFGATIVDFAVNTVLLAGVIALATQGARWRSGARTTSGACRATSPAPRSRCSSPAVPVARRPGMLLAIPPLYLIYYSYEIYVKRARDRVTFDAERDSFHDELSKSTELHEELRSAQLKVAAEIERARRIQADLLPASSRTPRGCNWRSAWSSSARWAATTTTTSPSATAASASSAAT